MMRVNARIFSIWYNCLWLRIIIISMIFNIILRNTDMSMIIYNSNVFPFVFFPILHHVIHLILPIQLYWNIYHSHSLLSLLYFLPKYANKSNGKILGLAQDTPYALILWYVPNIIYLYQFSIKSSNLFFDLIDLIVRAFIVWYK